MSDGLANGRLQECLIKVPDFMPSLKAHEMQQSMKWQPISLKPGRLLDSLKIRDEHGRGD